MPLVSIVLPTYNGARYLREAVDSCLDQTFSDLELIVVMDGGTDESNEILSSYDDPRLIVKRTENQGVPRALNKGFGIARGEFLSWTSDDNLYMPDAIGTMWECLQANAAAAMVCANCILIDENAREIGVSDDTWACFLYRRSAAEVAGKYRPEFRLVEDVDFFLRLQHFAGPIERIPRPYYLYRIHRNSLSHNRYAERQVVSLKMHYDLASQGVLDFNIRDLFVDKMSKAALGRDPSAIESIVDFAREKEVPFLDELEARQARLCSPWGWLLNRLGIAVESQMGKARQQCLLIIHWLKSLNARSMRKR